MNIPINVKKKNVPESGLEFTLLQSNPFRSAFRVTPFAQEPPSSPQMLPSRGKTVELAGEA